MKLFRTLNLLAVLWCFGVVVFGAYVRLSDAGLGCPDWPGCYGHLGVPDAAHEVQAAEARYPERPVEAPKAWKEMGHRYLAEALGLAIVVLAGLSVWLRRRGERAVPKLLPWALVALVCFQGLLGMWTVTWQLKPLAVTAHLAGGMTTLALLFWMWRSTVLGERRMAAAALGRPAAVTAVPGTSRLRALAAAGLVVVAMQILLGGWTSSNYAALACPDLPTCHGELWPGRANFREGFVVWRGLEQSYEGGVLDSDSRIAIHLAHRAGAVVVTAVLLVLAFALVRASGAGKRYAAAVVAALSLQIVIGISVVHFQLPLLLADAHNAGAALLLLTLVAANRAVRPLRLPATATAGAETARTASSPQPALGAR